MTPPEAAIWTRIRTRQPGRPSFRRQHPIGPYILDFYCAPLNLAIEIDGQIHDLGDNPEHDNRRTAWLNAQGIEVIRFSAADVLKNADEIADAIWLIARKRVRGE